jgi:molybdopterin synthase sulfur carrier subunit
MIRVLLPTQLCNLANVGRQVELEMAGSSSISAVLDELEARYPMLRGTLRDQVTLQRRPFIRFFVAGEDLSQAAPSDPLPESVSMGKEPLKVVGAMAGG